MSDADRLKEETRMKSEDDWARKNEVPISALAAQAALQLRVDQMICLGAEAGPGNDIVISPSNPISERWKLEAKTPAGRGLLERIWQRDFILNPSDLAKFKALCEDWGLSHETDWNCVVVERIDP